MDGDDGLTIVGKSAGGKRPKNEFKKVMTSTQYQQES